MGWGDAPLDHSVPFIRCFYECKGVDDTIMMRDTILMND